MKRVSLRELIGQIWSSGNRGLLSPENLFDRIQTDGGHDAEGLTLETLVALLDEE